MNSVQFKSLPQQPLVAPLAQPQQQPAMAQTAVDTFQTGSLQSAGTGQPQVQFGGLLKSAKSWFGSKKDGASQSLDIKAAENDQKKKEAIKENLDALAPAKLEGLLDRAAGDYQTAIKTWASQQATYEKEEGALVKMENEYEKKKTLLMANIRKAKLEEDDEVRGILMKKYDGEKKALDDQEAEIDMQRLAVEDLATGAEEAKSVVNDLKDRTDELERRVGAAIQKAERLPAMRKLREMQEANSGILQRLAQRKDEGYEYLNMVESEYDQERLRAQGSKSDLTAAQRRKLREHEASSKTETIADDLSSWLEEEEAATEKKTASSSSGGGSSTSGSKDAPAAPSAPAAPAEGDRDF